MKKNKKKETVAAVVVTYNRKEMLFECIDSLLKQSHKLDKIIIIDNNSTDGTVNDLKKHGYLKRHEITCKCLDKNIGGAGGFYEGIKLANQRKYDWVWVMDDDVEPENDCLEKLLLAKDNIDEKVSFLASVVFRNNGKIVCVCLD